MQTAHEIIASFVAANAVDMQNFWEWFRDCGYPQEEANVHDSRFLTHLQHYVEEQKTFLS